MNVKVDMFLVNFVEINFYDKENVVSFVEDCLHINKFCNKFVFIY